MRSDGARIAFGNLLLEMHRRATQVTISLPLLDEMARGHCRNCSEACSWRLLHYHFSMHVRNKVGMLFFSGFARLSLSLSLRTQLFSSREACCVECCSTPVVRRPTTRHVQLRWPHHPCEGRKRLARVNRSTFGQRQTDGQTDAKCKSPRLRTDRGQTQ